MNAFTEIATSEPLELVVGDLWQWKRSDLGADYPPADYTLTYVARLEGHTIDRTLTASASGSDFLISETPTEAWADGRYQWTAFITRTSDSARVKIDQGYFIVKPDPADANADPRSHAAKTLAAIQAVIEGRATKDIASYSINGRSLSKMSIDELMTFRRTYQKMVNAEKRAEAAKNGKSSTNYRVVRFC